MSYTQTDLDNVRSAIMALAQGTAVVEVEHDGIRTRYSLAKINELRQLEQSISRALGSAPTRRYTHIMSGKGL